MMTGGPTKHSSYWQAARSRVEVARRDPCLLLAYGLFYLGMERPFVLCVFRQHVSSNLRIANPNALSREKLSPKTKSNERVQYVVIKPFKLSKFMKPQCFSWR